MRTLFTWSQPHLGNPIAFQLQHASSRTEDSTILNLIAETFDIAILQYWRTLVWIWWFCHRLMFWMLYVLVMLSLNAVEPVGGGGLADDEIALEDTTVVPTCTPYLLPTVKWTVLLLGSLLHTWCPAQIHGSKWTWTEILREQEPNESSLF